MTETKTPREFDVLWDTYSGWVARVTKGSADFKEEIIHVVEASALMECRKELRLVRQNVEGQRRVNDRQYAEKLDLEAKLEFQTKNCISLFLHEQRIADLEAKLTEAHDGLAGNICGYCWDKKANEGYPSLDTKLTAANELIAELKDIVEKSDFYFATPENAVVLDKIKAYEDKK